LAFLAPYRSRDCSTHCLDRSSRLDRVEGVGEPHHARPYDGEVDGRIEEAAQGGLSL
jgi:hypothetical protein